MKATNNYFTVPRDILSDPRIELMEELTGKGITALAWWIGLLSLLYYSHGLIDLTIQGQKRQIIRKLQMADETELDSFLNACVTCKFIDGELLEIGHIVSRGVCEQMDYKKSKSEAGKKGMKARWGNNDTDSTC